MPIPQPQVTKWQAGSPPTEGELGAMLTADGLAPHAWGNPPGDRYGWHDHSYHKILYCISGSIIFHTESGDLNLSPGDRLDLPPRTAHAATVGPDGVRCIEAPSRE